MQGRCVHIGDRECDIYELFCQKQVGTHFVVRTCVERLMEDSDHTITDEWMKSRQGTASRRSQNSNGNPDEGGS